MTVYAVDGSSYSNINAACSAIESGHNYVNDGIADIQVSITSADTTPVTVGQANAETASASAYIRIEVTSAAKHAGKWNTSKQRLDVSSGSHCLRIQEHYVHLKNLQIKQSSSTTSAECIRVEQYWSNTVIEKCILITNNTSQQDCIYAGGYGIGATFIFDTLCILGGSSARACIHAQNYTGSGTQTWHIEHCTLDAAGGSAALAGAQASSATTTIHCWNTAGFFAGGLYYDYVQGLGYPESDFVDGARANISEDTSATAAFGATGNYSSVTVKDEDTSGDSLYLTDITTARPNRDYQLLEGTTATNIAVDAAVSGATQDSRVDLDYDIAGNPRPATYTDRDIGAFEVVAGGGGGGGTILPMSHYNYGWMH